MIYTTWSWKMRIGPGGDYKKKAMAIGKKAVSYFNKKWPEINAQFLYQMFTTDQVAVVATFENVAASMKWQDRLNDDEGYKQIWDELVAAEREAGTDFFNWTTTFQYIMDVES